MARIKLKPKSKNTQPTAKSRPSASPTGTSNFVISPPNQGNEQYCLGQLRLGTTNNVLPQQWNKCNVVLVTGNDGEYSDLKMFFEDDMAAVVKLGPSNTWIKDILSSNVFAFRFSTDHEEYLMMQLYIKQFPLRKFNGAIGNTLKFVFTTIFHTEYIQDNQENILQEAPESENLQQFYKNIKRARDTSLTQQEVVDTQHSLLKVKLRPYQQEAVRWMLSREQFPKEKEMLHPLFEEVKLESGCVIYFNKHTGYVDISKPSVSSLRTGGILADEMGLGKTVEVLACILLSPKQNDDSLNLSESFESPSVLVKSKKRKFAEIKDTPYIINPKRLKIPARLVEKNSSTKSNLRRCLNMWYESKLLDVAVNKPRCKENKDEVFCICGNNDKNNNTFQCVDCLKFQHGTCLGYKEKFGQYRCPDCWFEQPLLESKGTLIVCPNSLRAQWSEEICKHVSGLRIFDYQGSKATPVYPIELLDYDIVITTYTILQSELRLSETGRVTNLRHTRRYSAQGSPLMQLNWWRLCLDEAQMVEVSGTMMSTMAKKLTAQHRWAVTGTPITREIFGLYGLIDYLQLEPFSELETWKYLLYLPYKQGKTDRMFEFLAQVMWRWSKEDVFDQIGIPSQRCIEYPLEFSAVESFFYRKEHNISANDFKCNISRAKVDKNVSLKSLDRQIFNFIMVPLVNIRRACSSAGTSRGRYLVTRKQVSSIKDLLDALITKNLNFCEENLRLLVSSLNGLAGINILSKNLVKAVAEYRKVLRLASRFNAEDPKKGLAVDKLQLIHTMHNLAEVLASSPPVEQTLRDSTLRKECLQLQGKYLEKYISGCLTTYEESGATTKAIVKLEEKYVFPPGNWFGILMEWVSTNKLFDTLVLRIANAADISAHTVELSKFSDEMELLYIITTWNDELRKLRDKAHLTLSELYTYKNGKINISNRLVNSAMSCHLRPENTSKNEKNICSVCKVSRIMRKYEAKLFDMKTQNNKHETEDLSNKGSWKITWEELVLRALLSLAKTQKANQDVINDGEIYVSVLDARKREFKQKRKFWTYLYQQINALDEINMCLIRINFKTGDCKKKKETTADKVLKKLSVVLSNPTQYIHFIEQHELKYQESLLQAEELRSNIELEKNLGTYKYLQTLSSQQYAGTNPDPCPICKNELQDHWSILPCGHSYCLECMQSLLTRNRSNITCSICRQTHRALDVSYIRNNNESNPSNDEFRIKGDYSSKIEAIVKLIIKLRYEDDNVKVLVFSTWADVLSIIQKALHLNDISCEVMFSNDIKNRINNFKDPEKKVTALLLPISLGSKGLNLIEATHVILVEPLLNPGDELQALGRVHRIGQTRATTVHKFIMQGTIEENIHKAIAADTTRWGSNKYTLEQLIDLFVTNENSPIEVDEVTTGSDCL